MLAIDRHVDLGVLEPQVAVDVGQPWHLLHAPKERLADLARTPRGWHLNFAVLSERRRCDRSGRATAD